jgi:hypothetical protein
LSSAPKSPCNAPDCAGASPIKYANGVDAISQIGDAMERRSTSRDIRMSGRKGRDTFFAYRGVVLALIFSSLPVLASAAYSQQKNPADAAGSSSLSGLTDRDIGLLYGQFREIRYFSIIAASVVGDASQLGLEEEGLANYLESKFKDRFGESMYRDVSGNSREFLSLVATKNKQVGNLTSRVWVVIDGEVVIYHVKLDAGNFDNPSIWTEEVMGHGTRAGSPDAIRNILDEMMKEFASVFFRVRGRQM